MPRTSMTNAEAITLLRAEMEMTDDKMPIQIRVIDTEGNPIWYLAKPNGRINRVDAPHRSIPMWPPEAAN